MTNLNTEENLTNLINENFSEYSEETGAEEIITDIGERFPDLVDFKEEVLGTFDGVAGTVFYKGTELTTIAEIADNYAALNDFANKIEGSELFSDFDGSDLDESADAIISTVVDLNAKVDVLTRAIASAGLSLSKDSDGNYAVKSKNKVAEPSI